MLNLMKKFMSKKARFYENHLSFLKKHNIHLLNDEKTLESAIKAMIKSEKYVEKHLDELIEKYPGKILGFSDGKIFVGDNHDEVTEKLESVKATIPFFAFEVPEKL